eukprot:304986_1
MAKLYVGRIGTRTKPRDLEDLFAKYGRTGEFQMKSDFGFIEFNDERDAEDAVHELDGTDVDGQRLIVQFARGTRGGRYDEPRVTKCFNCGKIGHWARDCPAGDWSNKCYNCGEPGHIKSECREDPRGGGFAARDKAYTGRGDRGGGDRYDDRRGGGDRSDRRRDRSYSPRRRSPSRSPRRRSRSRSRSRSR